MTFYTKQFCLDNKLQKESLYLRSIIDSYDI